MYNIDKQYSLYVQELSINSHLSITFKGNEINELITALINYTSNEKWKEVKKTLFLFQYSRDIFFNVQPAIEKLLTNKDTPEEIIIFSLGILSKHVISVLIKENIAAPKFLTNALLIVAKKTPQSHELDEWFLRTIEPMQVQDLRHFEMIIKEKYPSFFYRLTKRGKAQQELIKIISNKLLVK